MLVTDSIVFQDTFDPEYAKKRKALSGAFFKQKLIGMTEIIKQVTLNEIRLLQEAKLSEVDIV